MKTFFSNIVLFCGGANVGFLRSNCEHERHKFYPIGLGVIITTSLGFISMMFATNSIFGASTIGEQIVLILFSLFWAFAIFTIDWGLVKTMRKSDNTNSSAWVMFKQLWLPVVFRIAVAIILSYSISRPLEVKIYEQRLKAQIEQDRQDFITRELKKKDELLFGTQREINALTKEGNEYLGKKNQSPQTETFKSNLDAKNTCNDEYNTLKINNNRKVQDLYAEANNIGSYKITPGAFREDSLGKHHLLQWARDKIGNIKNVQIPALEAQIIDKKRECDDYLQRVTKEQEQYQADYDAKIKSNSERLTSSISNKDSTQYENQIAIEKIKKASYVSFDTLHPGLITQLSALGNFEKTDEGKSAWLVRLILLAVIICIDTAPIVIKLLTKRGVYEEMVEAEEEIMQFLSRHENYANKHLIKQLSLAQKEVLATAIAEWKKNEKQRPDIAEIYINSNPDAENRISSINPD